MIDRALGEMGPALEASREAERVFAGLPPTYESRLGLASAQLQTGRLLFREAKLAEGEASTRQAVEALRAGRGASRRCEARLRLARAEVNLGNYARGDRPEMAMAQYQRALEQWEILCQPAIVQPHYLEWYARTLSNLGLLMTEKGDPAGAVPILTDAVTREDLAQLVGEERTRWTVSRRPDQPRGDPHRRGPGDPGDPDPRRSDPDLRAHGSPVS